MGHFQNATENVQGGNRYRDQDKVQDGIRKAMPQVLALFSKGNHTCNIAAAVSLLEKGMPGLEPHFGIIDLETLMGYQPRLIPPRDARSGSPK